MAADPRLQSILSSALINAEVPGYADTSSPVSACIHDVLQLHTLCWKIGAMFSCPSEMTDLQRHLGTAGHMQQQLKRCLHVRCALGNSLHLCFAESTLQVTQRSTLAVTFGGTLAITGGSNTGNLQSDPVPDLTLNTQPVTGAGWLTTDYAGFTYTPKAAKYAACNPTNKCKFDFYAIDPATVTGSRGKACRFSITVTIDPIAVPTVSSSQLYADYSAASMSTAKAPLALLGLLAVPALFLLGL